MASSIAKYKNGVPPEHHECKNYIIVIGDEGIGKTSLIKYMINNEDVQTYSLLIFTMYPFPFEKPNSETPDHAAYADLPPGYRAEDRKFSYPYADIVLACFAIDDPLSLEHVSTTWVHEIRASQVDASDPDILLIGLKKDVRDDPSVIEKVQDEGSSLVTEDQARAVVEALHLKEYMECETKTGDGAEEIHKMVVLLLNE